MRCIAKLRSPSVSEARNAVNLMFRRTPLTKLARLFRVQGGFAAVRWPLHHFQTLPTGTLTKPLVPEVAALRLRKSTLPTQQCGGFRCDAASLNEVAELCFATQVRPPSPAS